MTTLVDTVRTRTRMGGTLVALLAVSAVTVLPLAAGTASAVTSPSIFPDTVIDSAPPAATSTISATFTFHGTIGAPTDNAVVGFECKLDSSAFSSCSSPMNYSFVSEGQHTFSVRSVNSEGVVDPSPATHVWTIDTLPPVTVFTTKPPADSNSTFAQFFVFASDSGAGGATSLCKLDGGSFLSCSSLILYSGLSQGQHTVSAFSTDAAGNVENPPISYTWRVDTTAPDTSLGIHPAFISGSSVTFGQFVGNTLGGSAIASFQCKLDSAPFATCSGSATFNGLASGGHTFELRAVDLAGNIDPSPASWGWSVDDSGPDTTIISGPASVVNSTSATFTFGGTDDLSGVSGFECAVDAGSFGACSSPYSLSGLADGPHTFRARAVDNVGNVDPTPATHTWTVDTVAPDTTFIASTPANTSATAASFTLSGNDGAGSGVAGFQCSLNGGPFVSCTSTPTFTDLTDGLQTLQVRAVDAAGNVDPTPASFSWVVDTLAPDTSIGIHPGLVSWVSATFNAFQGNALGGSSIASFRCWLDTVELIPCIGPITFDPLSEGLHTFELSAVDAAGNVDPTPATWTWTVDGTGADTTITGVPPTTSNSSSASFTFIGNDNASGISSFECALDAGGFSACSSPRTFTGLADGQHTVKVRAIDGIGNVDPTPATYTWTIDTLAPDTALGSGPPNPSSAAVSFSGFLGFAIGGTPVTGFECRVDGAPFDSCTEPFGYVGLADGQHIFELRAVDAAGNVDPFPASFTWTVDNSPPDTTILSSPTAVTGATTATFVVEALDPLGSVIELQCSLDGATFTTCTNPFQTGTLAEGSHVFLVRAVDWRGQIDPTPASHHWSVDLSAPDTTILTSPTTLTASADASFTFTGDDGVGSGVESYQCSLDGGTFQTCSSPADFTGLADGEHQLRVRAIDHYNRVDPTPASHTWTVDTTAPETTIDTGPDTATNNVNATFTFSGTDDGGSGVFLFTCRLDGGTAVNCTGPMPYISLDPGTHTLEVTAIDHAGNTDATPAVYEWVVDVTAPTVVIDSTPDAITVHPDAEFTFSGTDEGGIGVTALTAGGRASKPAPGDVTFECSLNGDSYTPCTSPQSYSGLTDGVQFFAVRSVDAAGNRSPSVSFSWTVLSTAGPQLSATKTVTGTFVVGGTVTYTIVVTNSGLVTQQDNPGDELSDVLPATLHLVSASATTGTVVADVSGNTVHWNGLIPPESSVTVTITATIVGGAGSSIGNQATLAFDHDDNSTNESSAVSDNPGGSAADEVTSFAVGVAVSTSTTAPRTLPRTGGAQTVSLTQWSLLLVGGGLVLLATRRRRRSRLTSM